MKNTGQSGGTSGIDIKAEQAWAITQGSSNIKIAVLDDGVDLTHPDLQANLLPGGYDVAVGAPGGANGSAYGNNAHGTECAGIIAAIDNTVGVIGVAPDCKILPIRIGYTEDATPLILMGFFHDRVARAIRYAWDTVEVDVLSNSWSTGTYSSNLNTAFTDAMTQGRGGKGCVVVFAAGNTIYGPIDYPANAHPDIIAVGRINRNGYAEDWYTSSELDVMAPGAQIYTTDLQGNVGDNKAGGLNGNYYSGFNGTSAAAPHVAGVAALILSANPNLTQKQVANIIESTAQKINPNNSYSYSTTSGRNNGTWNQSMGYGMVNAYAAVNQVVNPPAPPTTPTISSELVEQGGGSPDIYAVFSVDTPQTGVTYQWDVNGTIKSTTTPCIAFMSPFKVGLRGGPSPISLTIKCRASSPLGGYSSWSNEEFALVESVTPISYHP